MILCAGNWSANLPVKLWFLINLELLIPMNCLQLLNFHIINEFKSSLLLNLFSSSSVNMFLTFSFIFWFSILHLYFSIFLYVLSLVIFKICLWLGIIQTYFGCTYIIYTNSSTTTVTTVINAHFIINNTETFIYNLLGNHILCKTLSMNILTLILF